MATTQPLTEREQEALEHMLKAQALGSGPTPGLRGKQPLILMPDQRSVKSQQRRGSDGNRDFQ